jgi:hypothetical protein
MSNKAGKNQDVFEDCAYLAQLSSVLYMLEYFQAPPPEFAI